mmetsp:Transcript_10885/g.16049  ORF Transcript_10885/g.16049 Transcript_10885/m.16049 type:complete len:118 (-) Transcript_10885:82-435(-)
MLRHHHTNDIHCLVTPRRTQTEGSPNKKDTLDKVKSSKHKLRCESNLTRIMESLQPRVIEQERVNDFPQHFSFVDMTRPRKNGRKRTSTEYHIFQFVPCFGNMTDGIELDDMSIEEE